MRQQYDKKYIVIHEPIRDKHRRRLFERKLNEATSRGYKLVGNPTFHSVVDFKPMFSPTRYYEFYGTVLLRK